MWQRKRKDFHSHATETGVAPPPIATVSHLLARSFDNQHAAIVLFRERLGPPERFYVERLWRSHVFSKREEFHNRASQLESAARKLQDPEARQQLRDLARQWRHMADGWNNVFGQTDPAQCPAIAGASARRKTRAGR